MSNFDPRIILLIGWLIAGIYGLVAALVLVRRRRRLNSYLKRLPMDIRSLVTTVHLTVRQEEISGKSSIRQALLHVGRGLAIVIVGLIAITPPDVLALVYRQWVSTICILYLAVALDLSVYTELSEDHKLEEIYREGVPDA